MIYGFSIVVECYTVEGVHHECCLRIESGPSFFDIESHIHVGVQAVFIFVRVIFVFVCHSQLLSAQQGRPTSNSHETFLESF